MHSGNDGRFFKYLYVAVGTAVCWRLGRSNCTIDDKGTAAAIIAAAVCELLIRALARSQLREGEDIDGDPDALATLFGTTLATAAALFFGAARGVGVAVNQV